jgi:hypothetical protein
MPKLNTNVQLSPTEATLQDDPTVAEDELEAGKTWKALNILCEIY